MKVKQIEYRKLKSDGQFNNETYGCTVELNGSTEEEAMTYARGLVDNWHHAKDEVRRLGGNIDTLQWKESDLEREILRRRNTVRTLKITEDRIRERLGLPPNTEDDIPF